jgi:hypothetical protein
MKQKQPRSRHVRGSTKPRSNPGIRQSAEATRMQQQCCTTPAAQRTLPVATPG